ncbi:protein bax [Holospora obtusa F1]|uniref:Protein bax n=1 Tax=Holospora obtusa F1 TaxID=1399147 RepID=W6TEN5_HOLOB|nr:glucosaminidase domain-containing protein [Holospora obtusa]ETZ07316.1 protein bax [Holospora obtusa F1]
MYRWAFLVNIGVFSISFSSTAKNTTMSTEKIYHMWEKKQRLSYDKKSFIRTMYWKIWKENYRILYARMILLNMIRKNHQKKKLTFKEKVFLNQACKYYKVSSWKNLLNRMDVIPISMALAQSIQECGWGRSFSCLNKNAYFGMMSTGKKCHRYHTPEHSVQAYIRTLNTHRGYKKFRAIRQMMRERNQDLRGYILINELYSYCEDPNYPKIIQKIARKYHLFIFDLMIENAYRHVLVSDLNSKKIFEFKQRCFDLAKHPKGAHFLAQMLWTKICENFSKVQFASVL